jgi:hypothetical protein
MAEAYQLGPLSSGLSRAWSWPLVATVASDIVDVLETWEAATEAASRQ